MKCIAAVDVDLDHSPIGTRSRAAADINGTPVLTRTVRRIVQAERIDHLFIICPQEQSEACQALVPTDLNGRVTVKTRSAGPSPFRDVVRTARKWSLDGWRGGVGGVTSLDEYANPRELAMLVQHESPDSVFCAPAESPLIDPALIDTLIADADRTVDEARLTFTQAPPGLAGTVFRSDILVEMAQKGVTPGMILSYKPDMPAMDLALKSCCHTAADTVRHAAGRLVTDTERSFATVAAFLDSGQPIEAEVVGRWLIERDRTDCGVLPREVEIELTTADQLPNALLRPRGPAVGSRGPIDLRIIEKIADELSDFDDSLVVLGGFGEPLLHPRFDEVLNILRRSGIYGIAVRTNGIALDEARIESLIRHQVDVVNVLLDAWTPALYQKVQDPTGRRGGGFEEVCNRMTQLARERSRREVVAPLIVPEMTKSIDTIDELDPFFDGWIRKCGWASIAGYSNYAGQREDRSVMSMAPPRRSPCRRINRRAMVLSDGRMPVCDQDFTGKYAIGDLHQSSLHDLWAGPAMRRARDRHLSGDFDAIALCDQCEDWHRP